MLTHLLSADKGLRLIQIAGLVEDRTSWISQNHSIDSIRCCLADEIGGPVNIVSLNALSHRELVMRLSERMAMRTALIPSPLILSIARTMEMKMFLGVWHADQLMFSSHDLYPCIRSSTAC